MVMLNLNIYNVKTTKIVVDPIQRTLFINMKYKQQVKSLKSVLTRTKIKALRLKYICSHLLRLIY